MSNPSDLEHRIARLEDIENIRKLISKYAEGADKSNDIAIMHSLFTTNAIWKCEGFGSYEGVDQITSELARIAEETIIWSLHYMVSPNIEVSKSGNDATCDWSLWELATITEINSNKNCAHWIGGYYKSQLRKESGEWKFSSVILDLKILSQSGENWDIPITNTEKFKEIKNA